MEIVLQGRLFEGTFETARRYLREEFIDRVIVSCWDDDPDYDACHDRIDVVRSASPAWPGQGNINYQIVSSAAGVAAMQGAIGAKMRSDQRISSASLRMMHEFAASCLIASDAPLFVIGDYQPGSYPFHPQDHVFWGRTESLARLFDLPLSTAALEDPSQPAAVDYSKVLRANLYLGAHFYAKQDARIAEMISDPATWLLDGAPRFCEACDVSTVWGDGLFKVFPRVELTWEKRGWSAYPFDLGTVMSECWHEAPW